MRLRMLLIVALHLFSHHTPASSAERITEALIPGQSLAAGDKLVSGNGKFALGFFQLAGAGSEPSRYTNRWHLGMWFNKIPKFTTVWVANREEPLADPSSSELTFSGDGNLVLRNRATNATVWSSGANVTAAANATELVLLDTGNLVLRGSATGASGALWQSFDHPADTLLPDATIGLDKVTGRARRLVSRRNLLDPSPGVYSMELGLAGVVQMLWNSSVPYWSSGDWNGQYQYFSSVPGMAARHLFDFTFVDDAREVSFAYHLRNETDTVYSFVDVSGQRKVLLWQESTREWITIYRHPELRCDPHAACGPFAVCDDNAAEPCSCLRGFSVAAPDDWELGDRTAGCKRDVPLDCGGNGSVAGPADRFYAVAAVRLPYDPRSVVGPVTSAAECEQACLSTCSCSAYSFGPGGCSAWHGELINVRHLQLADAPAGNGEVLHLRLAAKEFQTRRKSRAMVIGGAIATGTAALGVSVLVLLLMVVARRNRRHRPHCDGGLIAFRYRDLQRATGDFSDKIGAGGFGSVFKGSLNTSTTIAVKRLHGSCRAEKQFRAEVGSIGILQHTNLVKMIGFCCERDRRLLVYEHMPNLSLDVHLFRSKSNAAAAAALSWGTRYRVALGVARGLAYLHESCRDCVIHCDASRRTSSSTDRSAPR
ncbi:G-type lectin S-receptor-like serine/threonine-protein kinase [Panicum miliaceum]|uniref:non-specific serine/threonine protein kinase n=1 Tax=Panicum miliaceum TaxID=4540 RepID=A0A3L6QCA5_PANMI|nr:G-type lectin S-receptor-like serine/threonine-protein kinase [Panicum miliaceum]